MNATDKAGKYVDSVDVADGVITITYGGQANDQLITPAPKTLTLRPGVNDNGDVVWQCGNATAPSGASQMQTPVRRLSTTSTCRRRAALATVRNLALAMLAQTSE